MAAGFQKARHLAQAIAIDENRYARYERGQSEPSIEIIVALCSALRVTPNDLFGVSQQARASRVSVPGLAEGGQDYAVTAAGGAISLHGENAIAVAAWRLAYAIAVLRETPEAGAEQNDAIGALTETARIFTEFSAAPFDVLVRLAGDPAIKSKSKAKRQQFNSALNDYIRALQRNR